jgi:PAS domain S-box-containing protein
VSIVRDLVDPQPRADDLLATLLPAIWNALESALMIVDGDTTVLMINPAAEALLTGWGIQVGKPVTPLRPDTQLGDGSLVVEQSRPVRRALAGEVVREEEVVVPGTAGSGPRRFVVSAYPFTEPDGRALAMITWRDVTSNWQQEESRRTALERLNRLLHGAADYAILMLDADGRVSTWSDSAERVKGYRERDILGMPFETFFTPEDRAAGLPRRILLEAAETGRVVTHGERVRADGTRFWARGVITAQHGEDGALLGFVKVAHDITEEHRARQEVIKLNNDLERRIEERTAQLRQQADELSRTNEELEAFSYSVSHDLRAPLRAVEGFARILVEDQQGSLGEEGMHYLERIRSAATEMDALIVGLLAFSRLQRLPLADETLDMAALVRGVWESIARPDHEIDFELGALLPARGDRRLVTQVWVNLLENSVKFTSNTAPARIRVSAEPEGANVAYVVADNGAGFDMAFVDKIFNPFQRLHRASDYPGTGIGLALVQRIVRRHGGTITAQGTPGAGASFRFTLRAAP